MKTPDITFYAAAVRPQCWMDFYNSIGENDAEFEVIFIGPNQPDYLGCSQFGADGRSGD